jgi:hypothetical protein
MGLGPVNHQQIEDVLLSPKSGRRAKRGNSQVTGFKDPKAIVSIIEVPFSSIIGRFPVRLSKAADEDFYGGPQDSPYCKIWSKKTNDLEVKQFGNGAYWLRRTLYSNMDPDKQLHLSKTYVSMGIASLPI